jgi:hypothetical protein
MCLLSPGAQLDFLIQKSHLLERTYGKKDGKSWRFRAGGGPEFTDF